MKWAAAIGNFFFAGLGYLIAVPHKRLVGALWTVAALILTYVEQVAINAEANPTAFGAMFVAVFVLNTAFAIDGYREAARLHRA